MGPIPGMDPFHEQLARVALDAAGMIERRRYEFLALGRSYTVRPAKYPV